MYRDGRLFRDYIVGRRAAATLGMVQLRGRRTLLRPYVARLATGGIEAQIGGRGTQLRQQVFVDRRFRVTDGAAQLGELRAATCHPLLGQEALADLEPSGSLFWSVNAFECGISEVICHAYLLRFASRAGSSGHEVRSRKCLAYT